MAKPLFGSSIIAELERDRMHTQDIAAVLKRLAKWFDEEGIPFALIGALAMRHHGYVRHTEDIDLLTTKEGLDRIHARLVGRGIVPRATGLRKKLRETEHHVDIDVITAGEHAGSSDSPVVYPDPMGAGFHRVEGYRVPDIELLVTFKLGSGVWGNRHKDLGDVQELIKANRLPKSFARKLPAELRPKFLELHESVKREKDIE